MAKPGTTPLYGVRMPTLAVRMPSELRVQLEARAAVQRVSLAAYIRWALERAHDDKEMKLG